MEYNPSSACSTREPHQDVMKKAMVCVGGSVQRLKRPRAKHDPAYSRKHVPNLVQQGGLSRPASAREIFDRYGLVRLQQVRNILVHNRHAVDRERQFQGSQASFQSTLVHKSTLKCRWAGYTIQEYRLEGFAFCWSGALQTRSTIERGTRNSSTWCFSTTAGSIRQTRQVMCSVAIAWEGLAIQKLPTLTCLHDCVN